MATPGEIGDNIRRFFDALNSELARLGSVPDSVTAVAVSKTFGPESVDAAIAQGLTEFGENRVKEASEKIPQVHAPAGLRWHFVGHLQRNKARDALALFDLIHSVDSLDLAQALERHASQAGKRQDVLIQINTGGEPQKSGCLPFEADELVGRIAVMPNLRIMGLMTVGPFVPDPAPVARAFRLLRETFDRLSATDLHGGTMRYCSMGMTDDWRIALAEGSNMLRIGRAIFGERT
jgi:pyridoxal phosphate enzyme (YggS family)